MTDFEKILTETFEGTGFKVSVSFFEDVYTVMVDGDQFSSVHYIENVKDINKAADQFVNFFFGENNDFHTGSIKTENADFKYDLNATAMRLICVHNMSKDSVNDILNLGY